MILPRFYRGHFDPLRDIPVEPGKALSIPEFCNLDIQAQTSVVSRNRQLAGDPGVKTPDKDYVPPFCRKGVTVTELIDLYTDSDRHIRTGLKRHQRDVEYRQKLQGVGAAPASVVSSD